MALRLNNNLRGLRVRSDSVPIICLQVQTEGPGKFHLDFELYEASAEAHN